MDEAEVRKIAEAVAGGMSAQIAEQVQSVIEKSITQFNGRFETVYREQNNAAIAINAVVGLLLDKKLITKEELTQKMDDVLKRAKEQKAKQDTAKTG